MGCSESKEELQLQDDYQRMLKKSSVLAAMEAIQIDFRDAGIGFYRLFARMDVDGSRSIDLDEFHNFFELSRSRLSDQVFSALGHQNASREVTFDDFVLNLWNFCTMGINEVRDSVFQLYDVDHNGTLDSAECESLFRLLYSTNDLSPAIRQVIADVDTNNDGVLDKTEFATLCGKNKALLKPVLDIQSKVQQKCLGKRYWATQKKKRVIILANHKDVFAVAKERLAQASQKVPSEPVPPAKTDTTPSTAIRPVHRASEVVAYLQLQKEREEFETWILKQQQESPDVDQYLKTYCEVHITRTHLASTQSSERSQALYDGGIQLLTDLRHHLAVCEKRFEEAKAKLMKQWGEEEASLRNARHETVRATMDILTPQALLKHAGKKDGPSAVGMYLQKKLDAATADVRAQFQQRWDKLERASILLADRALIAAPAPFERMEQKKAMARRQSTKSGLNAKPSTRVIPVAPATETWTEMFDTTHNRAYYVSSNGISTWERPAGFSA